MVKECPKCGLKLIKVQDDEDTFTYACPIQSCDYAITQKKKKPSPKAAVAKECRLSFKNIMNLSNQLGEFTLMSTKAELLKMEEKLEEKFKEKRNQRLGRK